MTIVGALFAKRKWHTKILLLWFIKLKPMDLNVLVCLVPTISRRNAILAYFNGLIDNRRNNATVLFQENVFDNLGQK